jgi:hypothetical protein
VGILIFEDALVVFSVQFLVYSELEMGGIFKKQCRYVSGSVPIICWVGAVGSGYFT